ncbi:hypothetical protein BH18ACT4_BH18ACT4_10050 [soil metagenome]
MDRDERHDHRGGLTDALVRSLSGAGGGHQMAGDDARHLHNGFGESLARAFELAVTPAVFAWLGWMLDRRVGTSPLFLVSCFAIVVTYMVWKLFVRYDAEMKAHEAEMFTRRQAGPAAPPAVVDPVAVDTVRPVDPLGPEAPR